MSKLRIKLLCNWDSSENLTNEWKKMLKDSNNIVLTTSKSDDDIDFYVIINGTNDFFIPNKSLYFTMEPNMNLHMEKWGYWSTPEKYFTRCYTHQKHRNLTEWHLSKNVKELLEFSPQKTKIMSVILSSKYSDPGQKLRVDFYNYLKNKISIDCYGNNDFLENTKKLPLYKKDEGLFSYKYTFNAENNTIPNYITEKLTDAILSETLCFYYGDKSVTKYIDERAFVLLELKDFEKDAEMVIRAIETDEWKLRLPFIKKEKERILKYDTMFDQIEKLL